MDLRADVFAFLLQVRRARDLLQRSRDVANSFADTGSDESMITRRLLHRLVWLIEWAPKSFDQGPMLMLKCVVGVAQRSGYRYSVPRVSVEAGGNLKPRTDDSTRARTVRLLCSSFFGPADIAALGRFASYASYTRRSAKDVVNMQS